MTELINFGSYTKNLGTSGLMLCDWRGYGSAKCYYNANDCPGADADDCAPGDVWSSTLVGNNGAYNYALDSGFWGENSNRARTRARSVRCVTELDE